MAKKDSLSRTYPVKIRYKTKDLADSSRLIGFQKMTEQAFALIERAIGDTHNTENATNSILSDSPLYINSVGRALGSMANLVPPLSGVDEISPTLANKLEDATYNVIPDPSQTVKCEVGCSFDGYDPSDQLPTRKCLKDQTGFYRQQEGSASTVCQAVQCPDWSGRDGQTIQLTECNPDVTSTTYREYKLVMPTEARDVDTYNIKYYSNCGAHAYDKYRSDNGGSDFDSLNKTEPSRTWALAVSDIAVSGTYSSIQYDYPNLDATSSFVVVVEVPRIGVSQTISINNVSFGNIDGTSLEPTRYLFDMQNISAGTSLSVLVSPTDTLADGAQTAISQIYVIERASSTHRNFGMPLLLPKVLDGLSAGTQIPPNFVQIFDTNSSVNRILDKALFFAARFKVPDTGNLRTNRDSYNIRIYDDQTLEIGNSRYLTTTVGLDVTTALGALMEAFIEHVSDADIHIHEDRVCELLQDKTVCCDDTYVVQVQSLSPANRKAGGPGESYGISLWVYGGTVPYDIEVDWDDGSNSTSPLIVSGVQNFSLGEDRNPSFNTPYTISHTYSSRGTYDVSLVVTDNETDGFGCTSDISSFVSPFNVGSPPEIDLEVRLDNISDFPSFIYQDIEAGYNFGVTESEDWTTDPKFHVISQIHNTDEEDGKPWIYQWMIDNTEGLIYQFYYENTTRITNETLSFASYSGTLAQDFVHQDSLVLKRADGTILVKGTDYDINWASGTVTAAVGVTIGASENVTANYFYYSTMDVGDDPTDITTQWITLGTAVNTPTIDLNVNNDDRLTSKQDIHTIRFKSKES